jgi:hypothetical protein
MASPIYILSFLKIRKRGWIFIFIFAFPASAAASIGRMPNSCDDLQKIGHRKSGLFSVIGNKTVDNVYCDFTKSINDAGMN